VVLLNSNSWRRTLRPLVPLLAALALACGGGGGGEGQGGGPKPVPEPVPAPVPEPDPPRQARLEEFKPGSGRPGTTVTLTGTGLRGASEVRFGEALAAFEPASSDTSLKATVPAGIGPGPVTLQVITPLGPARAANPFQIEALPVPVLDPLPVRELVTGSRLTLTGAHFFEPLEVTFGGVRAAEVTVVSPERILVVVPTGALAGPVLVKNPSGSGAPSAPVVILPPDPVKMPVLTSLAPGRGVVKTPVVLYGLNLSGVTEVSFGGVADPAPVAVSDTEVRAVVPPAAGSGPVKVRTSAGVNPSGPDFQVLVKPTLAGFKPAEGPVGAWVTLEGTGFTGTEGVTFGGVAAGAPTLVSDLELKVAVPVGAVTGLIQLAHPAGPAESKKAFTVITRPKVTGLHTLQGKVGDPLEVKGSGFTWVAGPGQVTLGGVAVAYTVVSDSLLRLTVPGGVASGKVRVTNPAGSEESAETFTVIAKPQVTGLQILQGKVGDPLEVKGSGFTWVTGPGQVTLGGVAVTYTVVSDSLLRLTVPGGVVSGKVKVTSPAGSEESAETFTVIARPQVTGLHILQGKVGDELQVKGSGFTWVTGPGQVTLGGVVAAYTVVSDALLRLTVPGGVASGKVRVASVAGSEESAETFTVIVRPQVTGLQTLQGKVGDALEVKGSGFTWVAGAGQVTLGGVAATYTVVSDVLLRLTVPGGVASGKVRVTSPAGSEESADTFTVLPGPTITGFLPKAAVVGTLVTIQGTNLAQARVAFGGEAATVVHLDSAVQVRAEVPVGAKDGAITVTTAGGPASSSDPFKVLAKDRPYLDSFSPTYGPPGSQVTVTGRNLLGLTFATLNGKAATFQSGSDTAFTLVVPEEAYDGKIRALTDRSATLAETAGAFRVTAPGFPGILDVNPAKGSPGTKVTILGENFHWIDRVLFGPWRDLTWKRESATEITATVPAKAPPGKVKIAVVRYRGGERRAESKDFRVQPGQPEIHRVAPAVSRPGFKVFIKGKGFTRKSKVYFNGTQATHVVRLADGELEATIPAGATTGPVRVKTFKGEATSAADLRVEPDDGRDSGDVFVDGWYLTQGTQDYGNRVPLVAGRSGLLRVFVRANAPNSGRVKVTATITGGHSGTWTREILSPLNGALIPTTIAEGTLGSSWNLTIPGDELAPGATLQVELDRGDEVWHTDRSGNTTVHPLDIRALPALRITLIPVRHDGTYGDVYRNHRTEDDYKRILREVYPLADGDAGLDLQVGGDYTTSQPLRMGGEPAREALIDELFAVRSQRGEDDRIYVALIDMPGDVGLTLGRDGKANMISAVWNGSLPTAGTFAHEVGHAMGLLHAPFNADNNDRNYWPEDPKYAAADIGVYGYNLTTGQLVPPHTHKDLMCYGTQMWISDFSYRKIIEFLDKNHRAP